MKIDIDGTMYEYDGDALTLAEAFELKEKTGWGLRGFWEAYNDREPAAYAWIAYVARKRAGERLEWMDSVVDLSAMIDSINADDGDASDPAEAQTGSS